MVRHDTCPPPVHALPSHEMAPTLSGARRKSAPKARTNSRARELEALRHLPTAHSTLAKPPAPRLPVVAQATSDEDNSWAWRTLDLSAGGVFLCGDPLLPIGHEMDVTLWLPNAGENAEVVARARVAWLNAAGEPTKRDLPPGMGIEFVEFDTGDDRVLTRYLRSLPRAVRDRSHRAVHQGLTSPWDGEGGGGGIDDEELAAPTRSHAIDTGERVGPYRLLQRLGSGYSGEVYIAEHLHSRQWVAVKHLALHLSCDSEVGQQYYALLNIIARLSHPNLVELVDYFSEGPDTFSVSAMVRGLSVTDLLAWRGAMEPPQAVGIAMQVCAALHAAHRAGVHHGDIRPSHVLLTSQSQRQMVKLINLGIGAALAHSPWGRRMQESITAPYCAPELLHHHVLTVQTDVYAVGALLHEMLTGAPPGPSPLAAGLHLPNIPADLLRLIGRCLSVDPAERPKSMKELHESLQEPYA